MSTAVIVTPAANQQIGFYPFGGSPITAGVPLVATLTLSDAQLANLLSAPVTMIAAPGASKVISVNRVIMACRTLVAWGASQSGTMRYAGGGNAISIGTMFASGAVNYWVNIATGPTFLGAGNDNAAIEIVGSANPAGGTTKGGCKIVAYYSVETIPI